MHTIACLFLERLLGHPSSYSTQNWGLEWANFCQALSTSSFGVRGLKGEALFVTPLSFYVTTFLVLRDYNPGWVWAYILIFCWFFFFFNAVSPLPVFLLSLLRKHYHHLSLAWPYLSWNPLQALIISCLNFFSPPSVMFHSLNFWLYWRPQLAHPSVPFVCRGKGENTKQKQSQPQQCVSLFISGLV